MPIAFFLHSIILSSVTGLAVPYFSTLSHKWCDFQKKKFIEHQMCSYFAYKLVWNISHSKKSSARHYHKLSCTSVYSAVQYSTVQCGIAQSSTVQCSIVQYNTAQYSAVQYSIVQYSAVQYRAVQYSTIQRSTVQYSTVQYSTVQYSIVQCSTVQCLEFWLDLMKLEFYWQI